ncbi:MAG TPA: GNAT family N-acetyltransferase [Nocardioides sp.]|nr:GNAT family N-acetyltransferase [Nocardioides sp.]
MDVAAALPEMQSLVSRTWSPQARHHPGQLAWSVYYGEGLAHGPVELARAGGEVVGWAWAESDDWLELCVDPARPEVAADLVGWFLDRAPDGDLGTMMLETEHHLVDPLADAGFVVADRPWFTHHLLDLADLSPVPETAGYTYRHVEPGEAEARAACHRAAWSPPGSPSRVTGTAYAALMAAPLYRPDLDWVAVDAAGEMVASACLWLDPTTGVVLVEPVGCAPDHRGRGLAGAVSLAALHAARDAGATTGLVCPRGDEDHPVPARIYRSIGFRPGPRTLTLSRRGRADPPAT